MPCDIGFKSYTRTEIPVPEPQIFSVETRAPEIDADLLDKLGVEDAEFLAWVSELDQRPLLEEALKRTLAKVSAGGIDFAVGETGVLKALGRFITPGEKKRLKDAAAAVSDRWQFEILGIVAEILDYTVTITQKGEEMVLEAEEVGKVHPCDSIKISRRGTTADITFEHFKSRRALDLATAKFVALADKLGVKIAMGAREVSEGDPFPGSRTHTHGHGHHHHHEH